MNRLLLTILCCSLIFSCSENGEKTTTNIPVASTDETAEMVSLLKQTSRGLQGRIPYFDNAARAQNKSIEAAQSKDMNNQVMSTVLGSMELIYANSNEQAITQLTKLIEAVRGRLPAENFYYLESQLALAYLRLGEQSNCIQNNNDESCLMPIQGKGVYAMKEGIRTAIQIYENLLTRKPDDKDAIWLLNFAYMTIGEYPHKVPQKYRLPASQFKSDLEIPKFKNIASNLGLNTVALSGGVAIEDFDNDGYLDIMASSWGMNDQLQFFKNNGNATFTRKTDEAGIKGITGGLNVQHADYNNDGFVDLLVLRGAWLGADGQIPNSLLKNNGDGTFTDVTKSSGIFSKFPTQTAVWADFNLDGWVDLFIGNETNPKFKSECELFINNQNGTFRNTATESGLSGIDKMVKGCAAGDLDGDGFPDLYVSVTGASNFLFKNTGVSEKGIPRFQNVSPTANVGLPIMSFPTWFWDYNNDGLLDIFCAAFGTDTQQRTSAATIAANNYSGKKVGATPKVYLNKGNLQFEEVSQRLGLDEGMLAMGSNYGDLNNDGFEDFYIGTGEPDLTAIVPNKMYLNSNGQKFLDVTTSGGFGHIQKGHAVGFGDLDNDGDQDVFCVLGGAYEGDIYGDALFLNPYGNKKNWVTLQLEGTTSNKMAIGARVKVVTQKANGQENSIYKTVSTGGSFGGNSLQLEIGLDDAKLIKSIEVTWPNKAQTKTIVKNIAINKFYKLVEGTSQLEELNRSAFSLN